MGFHSEGTDNDNTPAIYPCLNTIGLIAKE